MFEDKNYTEIVEFSEYIPDNLDKTVSRVVELLKQREMTIATAESCTGGLLSSLLTSVDGASSVFECGVCSYANRIKHRLLHVPQQILEQHSAVSRQTARAMLDGIYELSNADLCVSVTGYAGPQGGTKDDPVGSIYIGFRLRDKYQIYHLNLWRSTGKGRIFNRNMAAAFVFQTAEKVLMEDNNEQRTRRNS